MMTYELVDIVMLFVFVVHFILVMLIEVQVALAYQSFITQCLIPIFSAPFQISNMKSYSLQDSLSQSSHTHKVYPKTPAAATVAIVKSSNSKLSNKPNLFDDIDNDESAHLCGHSTDGVHLLEQGRCVCVLVITYSIHVVNITEGVIQTRFSLTHVNHKLPAGEH